MPTVIVPVGLNLGPSYRHIAPPDPEPRCWEVRLGPESEELTADEFRVWAAAFLDPERHSRLEVNRETVRGDLIAAGHGPIEPDAVLDQLLKRQLLLEFDPEGDLEAVFSQFKLFPLGEGMGNTADEPDRRLIGHDGNPLVKVTSVIYGLWAYSGFDSSIWAACLGMEDDNQDALDSGEDLEPLTAQEASRQLAVTLPMMIATGCAFLDPAC